MSFENKSGNYTSFNNDFSFQPSSGGTLSNNVSDVENLDELQEKIREAQREMIQTGGLLQDKDINWPLQREARVEAPEGK